MQLLLLESPNKRTKLIIWQQATSHYFLLFSQDHLKNHPKTVRKHVSQQSNTKFANVISQEADLKVCREKRAAWRAVKTLGQWKIIKTNTL